MKQPQRPIRCLLVDDEPLARDVMRRYIDALPQLELAGECANAIEALTFLQQHEVDLMLLDIHMPQLKGHEMLKTLRHPPRVIFTTAYAEYAVDGFELEVVDFLLKPIHFERFIKAINKITSNNGQQSDNDPQNKPQLNNESYVYFRADRKMVKVMLDDIIFIESMKDYLKVVTTGQAIVTKQSLTSVEAMLPATKFIRIHRSYMVNTLHITSYTHELLEIGKTELPIGKLYRGEVMQRLGKD
ncbi:MAG TPA: LytTR family DNA-binding domain-containing protein [Phnomibacter sp.]|nr:LytTR family DNA-binding domain-containing protein [Phnomibacter sp.]